MTRLLPDVFLGLLAATLGALLPGCSDPQPVASGAPPLVPRVESPAQVVARVNDRPILAAELRSQMKNGQSRKQALEQLIQKELLAQEAQRRGLHRLPVVGKLQRRAMAHRLIRRDFGDRFTKASIPRDLMDVTYKRMIGYFVHPEEVKVWHILVLANKRHPLEHQQRAKKLAREIHRLATREPLTLKQFKALEHKVDKGRPPLALLVQSYVTGADGPAVLSFARAAFAMQRKGQVSEVVKTIFGYHVIWFEERRLARNTSRSEADAEIRDKIFTKARETVFNRWIGKIEKQYAITVHPEVLAEVYKKRAAGAGTRVRK